MADDPADSAPDTPAALLARARAHADAARVPEALASASEAMGAVDRQVAALQDLRDQVLALQLALERRAPGREPASAPEAAPGDLPGPAQLEAAADRLAAQQPEAPQLLLLVGLDHFTRINDTWSRATGDTVLRACAAVLRAQSRPQDLVGRLDGDRFAIVPAGAVSTTRAVMVAERLRSAIHAYDWAALQAGMMLSASVGVAARAPGESLTAALARAEAALARCKRGGRNQVRSAD